MEKNKEKFISDKMRILVGKENYSRPQAYAISLSYWQKEGDKAQQGIMFNQPVPQNIGYTMPSFSGLPTTGYDFSYNNNFNPQPIENNTTFGQNQFSNQAVPEKIDYSFNAQKSFADYNQTQNSQEATNPYTKNSVNIVNPYGNIGLEQALSFAGEGFGSGNYGQAAVGTGLSVLKGARNFLTGYSTGKENKRVGQEYMDKTFDRTPNYTYGQQGGVKNSDIIAQNAITDQGQGNVNLEGNEFVMRTSGQVQPVVGDKHIENGKKADGVNAKLNDGDKVLSNYVKLKPTDIKDLKERYDISLKRGATFAEAQKKLDQKLGIKKLETEKAEVLEKLEKANKIKDADTKQLSLEVLMHETAEVNEKLNTLSGLRADNFEFLFQRQEQQPKKGTGTELYDKNGKEVTESNEEVAQQGLRYTTTDQSELAKRGTSFLNNEDLTSNKGINLKKIKNIQSGVSNDKLGEGYYVYYDKLPTDQGFDVNRNREFITQEAYKNTVMGTPAYQEYMKSMATPINNTQLAELQQGGKFTEQEKKIIQELVQKENIFGSFGDGIDSESGRGFEYGKAADYLAKPLYGVNYNRNEQILEEARRVVLENRAKRNNEIKSLKASDSYIDNVKGYAKDLLGFQQGGKIETLAKKHGISIERAQELMSFQQGGVQNEQEEVEEGQASNEQEEQGEVSPEQIISAFAQLSQQDPQQIVAQLQKMSPEEQNQALSQMMQALQQGEQTPQEEQMEGQYSNEQEEVEEMQQGGKKEYYEEGGKYSKEDQEARLNDFYNMTSGLGYEGKKDIGAMQTWMTDNYPNEVVKYFTEYGQPLTAKHVDIIKNKYKDAFKETGISSNKKSADYTAEEKAKLQTALGDKASKDFLLEGFKDNKWDWRFPMVAQKPMNAVQGAPQAQITAPNMSRFASPQEELPATQIETPASQEQKQAEVPSGVRNIMPNFGTYIPLFSPMAPIAKETVNFSRAEPIKVTPEAMLAEEESKRQADIARIEQSGLSPQQREALLAQGLASSQMASNDAIAKTEQYNAQNQYAVDQYNLGTQAKEDIMNAQFRQNFQDKAMQTLANNEESMRNQYRTNFLQEQANSNKVINMNTANALNDQFAITPNGVVALNNKPQEINYGGVLPSNYNEMTPEQKIVFMKQQIEKQRQLQTT